MTLRQQLAAAQAEVLRLKKIARCPREPVVGWIGGIVQQEREKLGMTLHALANESGVAVGLLSRLERNRSANPTLANLTKVAAALNQPLSSLLKQAEDELEAEKERLRP